MKDLHKFVKSVTHKNHLAKDIHKLTQSATHQKRSMKEFYKLVKSATPEQRANLAKLTGAGFGDSPQSLHDHIRFLRGGAVGQLFFDKSWKQVVTDVADHIHIDWNRTLNGRRWKNLPTRDIENAVVAKLFQKMVDKLSPQEREQLAMEMNLPSKDFNVEMLLAAGGAMAAARASGFGVYLMASTVLGGLTSALGITLPFAAYIGMSQAIAIVIGPVGWIALAGGLLHTFNQTDWQRLTAAVVYVAAIRNE